MLVCPVNLLILDLGGLYGSDLVSLAEWGEGLQIPGDLGNAADADSPQAWGIDPEQTYVSMGRRYRINRNVGMVWYGVV